MNKSNSAARSWFGFQPGRWRKGVERGFFNVIIGFLICLAFTRPAEAIEVDCPPVAGTYITQQYPDLNHFNYSMIDVRASQNNQTTIGLVRFDTSSIPQGSRIDYVLLSLFQISDTSPGAGVNLAQLYGSWNSSTVTWNNFGGSFAPISSVYNRTGVANTILVWDSNSVPGVANMVRQWVNQPQVFPNHGIGLRGTMWDATLVFGGMGPYSPNPGLFVRYTKMSNIKVKGRVTNQDGYGVGGVTISFSNGHGSAITDSDGYYTKNMTWDWRSRATASHPAGGSFAPSFITASNQRDDLNDWNFTVSGLPDPLPDFVIQSITLSPTTVYPGDTVNGTIVVKNQGAADGNARYLDWWSHRTSAPIDDSDSTGYVNAGPISKGSTKSFPISFNAPDTTGSKTFWALIDSTDSTDEENENNNARSASYTVIPHPSVETPTFSPDGGAHPGSGVNVTVSSATAGATIRYTTNGTEPTESSSSVSSGGTVIVPVPGTLKAKAFKTGMNPSATKSAAYTLAGTVATPTFNPDGGSHPGGSVNVTVSCATAGATIRYTTNGSEPTESSASVNSGGAVVVPVPGTLKTKAFKSGMNVSEVKSAIYYPSELDAVLHVSPITHLVGINAGYISFGIANVGSGSMPWTATVISGGDWIRIASSSSGTELYNTSRSVIVDYDPNPAGGIQRTAIIQVAASGAANSPQTVTITQAQHEIVPVPVYRFWSPRYRGHFFTINVAERNHIIANLWYDWNDEGVAYYAFPDAVAGTVPLYRFWSDRYKHHFYTTSLSERNHIIATLWYDWSHEGIAYYVPVVGTTSQTTAANYANLPERAHVVAVTETTGMAFTIDDASPLPAVSEQYHDNGNATATVTATAEVLESGTTFPLQYGTAPLVVNLYNGLTGEERLLLDGVAAGVTVSDINPEQSYWLEVALSDPADGASVTLHHSSFVRQVAEPDALEADLLTAIPTAGTGVGNPVERLVMPQAVGPLTVEFYSATLGVIETLDAVTAGEVLEFLLPEWNCWYRITARQEDGTLALSLWLRHQHEQE